MIRTLLSAAALALALAAPVAAAADTSPVEVLAGHNACC